MFAGHIGVALVIGRAERRVNIGVFVAAALLLDFVLWLFVLLGWESVVIPASFVTTRQAVFVFPYSHGLLAGLAWSALAAAGAWLTYERLAAARARAAMLLAAAVFSHWLLDALVHRPEMPLVGATTEAFGLGLWDNMPAALVAEAAIVIVGITLFIRGGDLSPGRAIAISALSLVILAFTVVGMMLAPPPSSPLVMAGSSLVTLIPVCALFAWTGRQPRNGRR